MKRIALEPRSCFLKSQIKSIHAEYFHGRASNSSDRSDYLAVEHSANFIPNIFCPSFHWVVCEAIANEIRELPEVRLREVRFARLFDLEMDFDRCEWDNINNEKIYTAPTAPLPKDIGTFFEVTAPSPWKTVSNPDDCDEREYTFDDFGEIGLPHLPSYYLSRPLIATGIGLLLAPGLFEFISHFIDRRFFYLGEIELDE